MPASDLVRLARVVSEPLSLDRVFAAVQDPRHGATAMFIGVVRDHDAAPGQPARDVARLDYSAHPTAETELAEVVAEVAGRHGVGAAAVEHRTGELHVGDLAVVVACGAGHRAEALAACRELIDELKLRVPIWKHQAFADGDASWVGSR